MAAVDNDNNCVGDARIQLVPKSEGIFKVNSETDVPSNESSIGSDWAIFNIHTKLPILDYRSQAFCLADILTDAECIEIINLGETLGFQEIPDARGDYRSCKRICLTARDLAATLYSRIQTHLNDLEIEDNYSDLHINGSLLKGKWKPSHLNPLFRLCRYKSGGHFAPHFDGYFLENKDCRSFKTLMIYLNADFTYGTTNFINEQQKLFMDESGRYCAEEKNILHRIQPNTGKAIIFNHYRLHEGAAIGDGVKYILRTDIMYQRTETSLSPQETEALQLLQEAERLEALSRGLEAVALYKKAFRLCPELENQ